MQGVFGLVFAVPSWVLLGSSVLFLSSGVETHGAGWTVDGIGDWCWMK